MEKQKATKKEERIMLPEGVSAEYTEGVLTIKKEAVTVTKKLNNPRVIVIIKDDSIILKGENEKKNAKRMINTYLAHIRNMVLGVTEGFTYKLKICSGHFPMTVKAEEKRFVITNFLGEKIPRVAKIVLGAEVKLEKDVLTITSTNKEAAGQTAANIERATFIKGRDRRLFQDGVYITEKPHIKFT